MIFRRQRIVDIKLTGGELAELIKKFTRRLVNYIQTCSPNEKIAIADYLMKRAKEDDPNKHLLEVHEKLRKEHQR